MSRIRYRRVQRNEPGYEYIQANKKAGMPICDASTHNSNEGCSNPACWKYQKKRRR